MAQYQSQFYDEDQVLQIEESKSIINIFLPVKIASRNSLTPALINNNRLNQWVQQGDQKNNYVPYQTSLGPSEYTLADWKRRQLALSFNDFKNSIIPITREILRLMLYTEHGKQWEFPVNPLNIIYDEESNSCRVFYRYPQTLKNISESWFEEIQKIILYLHVPEVEESTRRFQSLSMSDFYNEFLYNDNPSKVSDTYANLIKTYGSDNIMDLATQAFDIIEDESDENSNLNGSSDVESLLEKPLIEGADIIDDVSLDNTDYVDLQTIPVKNNVSRNSYPSAQNGRNQNQNQQFTQPKKSNKFALFLLFLLLVAACTAGYWYFVKGKNNDQQQANQAVSSSSSQSNGKSQEFYDGLTQAAANNSNAAAKDFDDYFANSGSADALSKKELSAVFGAYLSAGKYNQILKNIPSDDTVNALIKYLVLRKDTKAIKSLSSDNNYPIISFAKADVDNDQEKMVKLANNVDLSDNQQYQNDLCKAFADTHQLKKGVKWANEQTNADDLKNAIKNYATQNGTSQDEIDKAFNS